MANYVFKQFCGELDQASLDHLLEIVAKPMANDENMLEADSSEEGEDDSDDSQVEEVVDEADGASDEDESDQ